VSLADAKSRLVEERRERRASHQVRKVDRASEPTAWAMSRGWIAVSATVVDRARVRVSVTPIAIRRERRVVRVLSMADAPRMDGCTVRCLCPRRAHTAAVYASDLYFG
jgi:hypothetical protein